MYDTPENLPADNAHPADHADKAVDGRRMTGDGIGDEQAIARREDKRQSLAHIIWLTASVIVPFVIVFLTSHEEKAASLYHSFRLGLTSFFVALAILGLSQIDKRVLGARFDSKSQILASLLGVMLWLVWVGSGQMVYKAADEAKAGSVVDYGPPSD